jgi:LysM repeat protein
MEREHRQEIAAGLNVGYRTARQWIIGDAHGWRQRAALWLRDAFWYAIHNPRIVKATAGLVAGLFVLFTLVHIVTGRTFPNVWALSVAIGDMTVEEAETALLDAWENTIRIEILDQGRTWRAAPEQLGLVLDARKTAEAARAVGMAGIPLGYGVTPVVTVDELAAQSFLLDLTAQVNVAPYNAGYEWQEDQLIGVPGRDGRALDVPMTMQRILQDPVGIAERRRLEIIMTRLPPDVGDPTPYLEDARQVASQTFELTGYDPFTDQTYIWNTTREVIASWLEAGRNGLTLRDEAFGPFIDAQNATLNTDRQQVRYLDPADTKQEVRDAITRQETQVYLRIHYRSATYQVVPGDTGFGISRKTGIPFFLIQELNPSVDWTTLPVGGVINIPSRDVTLPLDPIPHKRIIVDLRTQALVAYENGQEVFRWAISSGISSAPTSPGIYQILNHDDVASGSSYTLCGDRGCGQWQMYWFMGVYEVIPGLMNGFHGAVLLPDGTYLGGGNVGTPYTFGCVMSENSNAEQLYQWAQDGTVVEIVSLEFQGESDLARLAFGPPQVDGYGVVQA